MSFPVEGSALQAQLEAWTNTTFSFDDFGPAEFKEKDEGETTRYGQHQHDSNGYSFGLGDSEHVDLESLLAPASLGPAALDPFHDYAPLAPSLVDPALHLPNFNNATTAPGLLQAPAPTPVELTPVAPVAPAPKRAAPKSKKTKVVAAPAVVSTPASDESASPGLILGDDEAANALAIEEDKRRRNTAASGELPLPFASLRLCGFSWAINGAILGSRKANMVVYTSPCSSLPYQEEAA